MQLVIVLGAVLCAEGTDPELLKGGNYFNTIIATRGYLFDYDGLVNSDEDFDSFGQMLTAAFGAKTYKLKFGHRGANQPVLNSKNSRVEISSQNHGFAVDADSFDTQTLHITHLNLNDRSVEGFEHKTLPLFAVQYHPEAAPGPHDSRYLFERFVRLMDEARATASS